jgi:hypothetical protein
MLRTGRAGGRLANTAVRSIGDRRIACHGDTFPAAVPYVGLLTLVACGGGCIAARCAAAFRKSDGSGEVPCAALLSAGDAAESNSRRVQSRATQERGEFRIAQAAFEEGRVGPIELRAVCKVLLTQPARPPRRANDLPQRRERTLGGTLAAYEVSSQSRQLEHSFPSAMITSIEPSPSGNISAVVVQPKSSAGLPPGPQHSIYIAEWSSSGLALRTIDVKFHKIEATAFDRNEDRLAIIRHNGAFPEGCIEIIDVRHGHTIASRACVLSPNGSSICWSPGGGVIGTVENDGFRFYDVASLEEIAQERWKYASHIEFSRDGKYLAFGAWSGGEIRSADSVLRQSSA